VVFLFFSICLGAAQAVAQDAGHIKGRVVDARGGEPLARVQVQLAGAS